MSNPNNPCIVDGKCASPFNLPEFIDTSACLCGLLNSKQKDSNGGLNQLWRCIGDASDNINNGENGKWYNTTLPSQELSAINQPQNWGENGPDLSQAYVLVDMNGQPTYTKLGKEGSPSLIGNDKLCTGKNDTQLSSTFYSHSRKNGTSSGTATLSSSISSTSVSSTAMSTMSSGSTMASNTATGSSTAPKSTASSSTSPAATPSTSTTSDASRGSIKAIFLIGMLLAPLLTLMA